MQYEHVVDELMHKQAHVSSLSEGAASSAHMSVLPSKTALELYAEAVTLLDGHEVHRVSGKFTLRLRSILCINDNNLTYGSDRKLLKLTNLIARPQLIDGYVELSFGEGAVCRITANLEATASILTLCSEASVHRPAPGLVSLVPRTCRSSHRPRT